MDVREIKFNHKKFNPLIKKCVTKKDAKKFICGKLLGSGVTRDVYEFKPDPRFVVKIERDQSMGNFCNVTEWRNYIDNRYWKWFAKYLAPCELISWDGVILIQRRIEFRDRIEYPIEIPAMFTDTKYSNFGWIGNQFVCCDYAFIPFTLPKKKYKRAKWFGKSMQDKMSLGELKRRTKKV